MRRPSCKLIRLDPRRGWTLFILVGFLLQAWIATVGAVGLTNVPLHDPSYDELAKLLALAGQPWPLNTQPISRLEMAGVLLELEQRADFAELLHNDRLAAALNRRLTARFTAEIEYRRVEKNRGRFDYRFAPLQTIQTDLGYTRAQSTYRKRFATADDIAADGWGLNSFDEHYQRPQPNGVNSGAGKVFLEGALELEDHFGLFARPFVLFGDLSPDNDERMAIADQLYTKAQIWNLAAEIGRDSLWWGPGHYGTLVLSDNAPSLNLVKLQTHEPFILPWFLSYLGPIGAQAFLSQLEEDCYISKPYLTGARLTLMPLRRLELGLLRTVQFGGKRENSQTSSDLGNILIGRSEHSYGGSSDTNQFASFDARLSLPEVRRLWRHFRQLQIWTEYAAESVDWNDVGGMRLPVPSVVANLYGGSLDFGVVDLLGEFADTRTRAHWYRHWVYRDGYTYQGQIVGHPADWGALVGDGRIRWYARPDLDASLLVSVHRWLNDDLDREQRDLGLGWELGWATEKHWLLRGGARAWRQDLWGELPTDIPEHRSLAIEGWLRAQFRY